MPSAFDAGDGSGLDEGSGSGDFSGDSSGDSRLDEHSGSGDEGQLQSVQPTGSPSASPSDPNAVPTLKTVFNGDVNAFDPGDKIAFKEALLVELAALSTASAYTLTSSTTHVSLRAGSIVAAVYMLPTSGLMSMHELAPLAAEILAGGLNFDLCTGACGTFAAQSSTTTAELVPVTPLTAAPVTQLTAGPVAPTTAAPATNPLSGTDFTDSADNADSADSADTRTSKSESTELGIVIGAVCVALLLIGVGVVAVLRRRTQRARQSKGDWRVSRDSHDNQLERLEYDEPVRAENAEFDAVAAALRQSMAVRLPLGGGGGGGDEYTSSDPSGESALDAGFVYIARNNLEGLLPDPPSESAHETGWLGGTRGAISTTMADDAPARGGGSGSRRMSRTMSYVVLFV